MNRGLLHERTTRASPISIAAFIVFAGCVDTPGDSSDETQGTDTTQATDGDTDHSPTTDGDSDSDDGQSTNGTADTADTADTEPPDRPTYYVSLTGDDSNPGTQDEPWRTIQHAVDTLSAGDLAIVEDGDYQEYVLIDRSGADGARLSFEAANLHGAKCRGFVVRGDFVDIDGFDVEAELDTSTGVFVDGSANVSIKNCFVHECPWGGIDVSGTTIDALSHDVEVIGNHLHHNGQWGIHVVGSHVLVEGNEISDSVQHHPKGDPPGNTGLDADGMRIFGDHHTIRANFIHGIADPSDIEHNIDPHADCLQTWDMQNSGGRPVMTDTVIERNHCIIQHPSGKGIMMSAVFDNPCHDITIRNNIFEFRDEGIEASQGLFANIRISNNVFKANLDDTPWGVSVHSGESAVDISVQNNIMVDCHAESRKIMGDDGTVDYNLVWHSNGAMPSGTPGPQTNELWGVDPLFVDYDGSVGGDFHLQVGSPAINAGASLGDVTDDHDGHPRPQAGAHDIGPYEYAGGNLESPGSFTAENLP